LLHFKQAAEQEALFSLTRMVMQKGGWNCRGLFHAAERCWASKSGESTVNEQWESSAGSRLPGWLATSGNLKQCRFWSIRKKYLSFGEAGVEQLVWTWSSGERYRRNSQKGSM